MTPTKAHHATQCLTALVKRLDVGPGEIPELDALAHAVDALAVDYAMLASERRDLGVVLEDIEVRAIRTVEACQRTRDGRS